MKNSPEQTAPQAPRKTPAGTRPPSLQGHRRSVPERVDVEGVEIAYRTYGIKSDPAVIFLHGFTGNLRNFGLNLRPISESGFHLLASDHPGHGDSATPDDPALYTMDALARIQHGVAGALGFRPAVVVGHSMGAAVAEEYAIAYPDDVTALVLIDSAGGSYKPSWSKTLDRYAGPEPRRVAFEQGMAALFDYQIEQGWRDMARLPEEILRLARSEFARTSAVGYFHACAGMRNRHDTLERLRELNKPSLIVHGENEDAGFIRGSRELHEAIRGSRLEVIAGATHAAPFEAPLEFNRVLIEFLRSL